MKKIKALLIAALLVMAVLVMAGCGSETTPYQINDAENYNVSVKFDANGGYFGTNTTVIVDSYNVAELGSNEIALLSPDNEARGIDAYQAKNPGYFLAGWYAERTETENGYTYTGKWDFETSRLTVESGKTYSAEEPALTLYAVWVPEFKIEFYDLASGELMQEYAFNPAEAGDIKVPAWDEETGAIDMYKFPAKDGFTFEAAYYDAEGTQAVDTENVIHPGSVNEATGQAENANLKLYLDWTEGEWYRIYNVEQFLDNASVSGNYEIFADLDFEGKIWPTSLMHGNFSGSIVGNGHVFKNINAEQTNNSKVNTGLFGALTETAAISDLTFENVTMTIKGGTRVAGASFGLLAGTISAQAQMSAVEILGSNLQIDAAAYFGTDDYAIGLLCGMGSADVGYEIQASVIGDGLWLVINDGVVTLSKEPVIVDENESTEPTGETVPEETQEA